MTALYHCAGAVVDSLRVHVCAPDLRLQQRLETALQVCPQHPGSTRFMRRLQALLRTELCWLEHSPDQGALLSRTTGLQVWQRFTVQAAHQLPMLPATHPCSRLHGHNFAITVQTHGTGPQLQRACIPLQRTLHRQCLNQLPGLHNPTSELLARWILERLHHQLPITTVIVQETPASGCCYDGRQFRVWRQLRFEAAARADDGIYGQGYRLRLQLRLPLDSQLGWTLDYAEITRRFAPLLQQLDHHDLGTLGAQPELLLRHIHAHSSLPVCQLELYSTTHIGMLLTTGHDPCFPGPF